MKLEIFDTPFGRFLLNPEDNISSHLIDGKFWEPELKPIFDALPDGAGVVEVGAYIGDHTVYLGRRHNVTAIEGFKRNFMQLCANLLLNDIDADPILAAMGDGSSLREAEISDGWCVDFENNASGARYVPHGLVNSVRLDDLPLSTKLDLLKIDAEGMDLDILRGAEKVIKESRPKIIFEINPHIDDRRYEYHIFFKGLDYSHEQIGEYNWLALPQ